MAIKNIGIDIREAHERGGGKGRYTLELTKALIAESTDTHFTLFTKQRNPHFQDSERVKQVILKGKGPLWHWRVAQYLKKNPHHTFIATTSYLTPLFLPATQKTALVVHDLVAFLRPEVHATIPTWIERLSLKQAIKKSQLILPVSKNTWLDLCNLQKNAAQKKRLILTPGVSPDFKPTKKKTMDLPDRFALAVGTLQPRKNLQLIFQAFPEIAKEDPHLHLCIAGGKGWQEKAVFQDFPKKLAKRIHFLGHVSDTELRELYSRSRVFFFPSLYEGFGIPPLEAMACGCPVIASNSSSLPEVVGNAAILIDPSSSNDLQNAYRQIADPQKVKNLKIRGKKRAALFTWAKSARALLKIIS